MEYFKGQTPSAGILVTFEPGDLLLEGLEEVLRREGIDFGVIPCGVGTLSEGQVLFAGNVAGELPRIERASFRGALEVGALQGPVIDGSPHVHMVLWNRLDGRVYVGHLEPGCRVLNRMEVIVQPTEGPRLRRVTDPTTGAYFIRPRDEG